MKTPQSAVLEAKQVAANLDGIARIELEPVLVEATPAPVNLDALARTDLESDFRIDRVLAEQAGTLTYLARENRRRRSVVLRVVDRRILEERGTLDALQGALSELAAIEHAGIVPLYDFGLAEHCVWWATQFVDAPSLADVVRREGPLRLERVRRIAKPVADALLYAHHHGLAHGGLTPDSLLVRADDWAVIEDFVRPETWLPGSTETTARSPGADQRALAVTIYRCLIGDLDRPTASLLSECPPLTALAGRAGSFTPSVRSALVRGADAAPDRRFGSVVELVAALNPGRVESPAPATSPSFPVILVPEPTPVAEPAKGSERRVMATAMLVIVAFAGLAVGLTRWLSSTPEPDQPAPAAAPAPVAVPVIASAPPPAPAVVAAPVPQPVKSRPAPDRTRRAEIKPSPQRVPKRQPTPTPPRAESASAPPAAESTRLIVSAVPGGTLYIDDRLIGPATEMAVPVSAGRHVVRITKPGYRWYVSLINVGLGEEQRLTGVALEPVN
jgi:serine/threonine-protein kinase